MQKPFGKPVVLLVCTGLGRINRGYESFTQECFDALKDSKDLDLFLVKGGGKKNKKEYRIANFHRKGKMAKWLSKLTGIDAYHIEQLSFLIALFPLLIRKRPAVIFYSDFILGTYLWQVRRFLKFKYKLLFSNGAPNGPPFTRTDHVQQLLPYYLNVAIQENEPLSKHTLLPYGIKMPTPAATLKETGNDILKKANGRKILLSVGAINIYHKRMDYVVREFAKLNPAEYFLIILGQFEDETQQVKDMAERLLKDQDYIMTNVPADEVGLYYQIADYFVLASLTEGFGRVLLEAASHGMPIIVHDYPIARQVLDKTGIYINMKRPGALSTQIKEVDLNAWQLYYKKVQVDYIRDSYSWEALIPQYNDLVLNLIKSNNDLVDANVAVHSD
jgi:1,2-diacylglycerol 3-alpha-glucosyltransferase